jgi:hypothetical protein
MYCEHCGQINSAVAKRCVGCNRILSTESPGASDAPTGEPGGESTNTRGPAIAASASASTSNNVASGRSEHIEYIGDDMPPRIFPGWQAIIAGALTGIIIALCVFRGPLGNPELAVFNHGWSLLLAPVVSGAITVLAAGEVDRRRWRDYLLAPMITMIVVAGLALLALIAVAICACMLPLHAMLGFPQGGATCFAAGFVLMAYAGIAAIFVLPPLFIASAGGGLIAGLLCRLTARP